MRLGWVAPQSTVERAPRMLARLQGGRRWRPGGRAGQTPAYFGTRARCMSSLGRTSWRIWPSRPGECALQIRIPCHDSVLVPTRSSVGGKGQGQQLLPSISARMSATSASGAFLRPGVAASMALARGGVGVIDRLGSGGSGVGSFSSGGKNVRDAEPVRPAWCDA